MNLARMGIVLWLALGGCVPVAASAPPPPANLTQRAGLDQKLGVLVPLNLPFRDSRGNAVRLGDLIRGRPTLLALGYFHCPNLCDLVLHGMARSAASMSLQPGRDYEIVFVSIDPRETSGDAREVSTMLSKDQPSAHVERWHLLTGSDQSVRTLSEAVGFRYFYDPRNRQYAHSAAAIVLTGEGRVAQYFIGVQYPPDALRLAVINASKGRLGSLIDRLVLLCCSYDPSTGRYSVLIGKTTQVVGIAFLLIAGMALLSLQRRAQG